MEIFKSNYITISITLFVLAIVLAHIFSTDNYNWTKNTISDLGSQGYDRKLIMQFGFLTFSLTLTVGILMNGLSWRTAPILVYGFCVGLTGIFCAKPFVEIGTYSTTQSILHSTFAQIAGVTFTICILTQILFTSDKYENYIHISFFVLLIGLSVSFGLLNNYKGIAQRLLYLMSFVWLIKSFKT